MKFSTLIICLAAIVAFCVLLAGNYIDYAKEVNRTTINRVVGE